MESIWSQAPPPFHLHTFHTDDASHRSTSRHYLRTLDVPLRKCPYLTPVTRPILHSDIRCVWKFISKSIAFLFNRIFGKNTECHTRVLSAYLSSRHSRARWKSAYFSHGAHWSELVNKSPPAHWLCHRAEESDCAGHTPLWIKTVESAGVAAAMRCCTLLDSVAECSICMEMSYNHRNMCPISCIL